MSWLQEKEEKVISAINQMTKDYIRKLADIWNKSLERKKCEDHLETMIEHTNTLFDEILQESIERRDRFLAGIAERQEEAVTLSRLLNVDVCLSPIQGLPLHTALVKLENDLQDLRNKLKLRKDEIIQLLLDQEALCEELGETPRELHDDPLPTEYELQNFRDHLKSLRDEKIRRKQEVDELRLEIRKYLTDLEIVTDTTSDSGLLNDTRISLTESTIEQLRNMRDDYLKQVENMRESIENMKSKLYILWDYLEVSPSVKQKFAKYTDYTQTCYDKFYQELDRCETQKKQNIKKFIDRIRGEIVELWKKTMQSEVEQARFVYFTCDYYTEDLLTLHEIQLEDLKIFYHSNQKIFELIEQRKVLWDRMAALEAKASEPGRYNNRGGNLLKEERERKTIATKLPKIEAELTELVNEFESKHQKKFLVYGENILDAIARDWELKKSEKEKLMSARKNAIKTPITNTPLRTPLTLKNHSTVKRAASNTNISTQPSTTKRKLLHTESLMPITKRNLMSALGTPRAGPSKTPFKSPVKKTRVIATTLRRKSGRASGNSIRNRKRSTSRQAVNLPKIKITRSENSASDTMSYDMFEDYIGKDPTCRSSIVVNESKQHRANSRTNLLTSGLCPTPPSRSQKASTHSPVATGSSRKLTTKNLPILI